MPASPSRNGQKLHETFKILFFLGFLVKFGLNLRVFSKQIAFISSKRPLGQQNYSLLNFLNTPANQAFIKKDKNCMKFLKTDIFVIFVKFRLDEAFFFETNYIYLFEEASWTTNSLVVEPFQLSKLASVSKY